MKAGILALALVFPFQAMAQSIGRFGNPDYATYQDPLVNLNSYGIPTSPLQKGSRHLKIVPAYVTSYSRVGNFGSGNQSLDTISPGSGGNNTWSENEAKGGGAVISWLHGLSDHWGYSVSLAFIKMSGKSFAFAEYNASNRLVKRHDADESGTSIQASALAIYDPFTNPEGFRLPIFFGYGFVRQDQTAEYSAPASITGGGVTAGNRISYKSSFDAVIPGFIGGLSAQFNTGPIRWTPFFAVQFKTSDPSVDTTVKNETTGAILKQNRFTNGDSMLPSGGIGVVYRPWDLAFTWAPNLIAFMDDEDLDHSIYTLSKTFKWGP